MKTFYVNTIIMDRDANHIAYLKKLTGPSFLIGKYNFIGGKVESGETHAQAAVREIAEEAFIDVLPENLVSIDTIGDEYHHLETFAVCVENELFAQIKQTGHEPIFTANLWDIKDDAHRNPSFYSPDFLPFLEATIKLYRL